MVTAHIEIRNPSGLHMRPGTNFVRLAKSFACEITVRKGDLTANAKSSIKLLKIGISQGDVIELACDGADEAQALTALSQYIAALEE